jgi:hypothetical protein
MSNLDKSAQSDWTQLLTDPELVGHIGKLLQAYREAPADKREEALLDAMRKIRRQAAATAQKPAAPLVATQAPGSPSTTTHSPETQATVGQTTSQPTTPPAAPAAPTASTMAAAAGIEPYTGPLRRATEQPAALAAAQPPIQPPFEPDLFTPSFGQDRRTYPRIRCFIAVELRCEGWDTPVWGNLANVSAGGCFIETVEPVRKSTKLEIGLWANNGKIWVKGIVINGVVTENNPTFGVRLQYVDMDASERETLRFFLRFVEDTTKNYEKQNGYLAQMKH